MPGETVLLGSGANVASKLEAMDVQLDRIGWFGGRFVGWRVADSMQTAVLLPAMGWGRPLKRGELGCVVHVQSLFGAHSAKLFGDCHPGSGQAYRRRARKLRVASGVTAGIGVASIIVGVRVVAASDTSGFILPDSGEFWGGLVIGFMGAGLTLSAPFSLGMAGGMSRYGKKLEAQNP